MVRAPSRRARLRHPGGFRRLVPRAPTHGSLAPLIVGLLCVVVGVHAEPREVVQQAPQPGPPPLGQPAPLSGFRYMYIEPPRDPNGKTDPNNLVRYAQERLRSQGWVFFSRAKLDQPSDLGVASRTLLCAIGYTANDSISNSVQFNCRDALDRIVIGERASGTGWTIKGDLEAALREITEKLQEMRPRFVESSAVNILSTVSSLERHATTESDLDRLIDEQQLTHPVEGVWSVLSDRAYRLGIVQGERTGEFVVIVFEAPGDGLYSELWEAGMVKARLSSTTTAGSFVIRYRMGNHEELNGVARMENGTLRLSLRDDSEKIDVELAKLRPSISLADNAEPETIRSDPTSDSVVRGSGTGFVVHPSGLVLTANHVVEDATTIEVACSGQPSHRAVVRSSSASTDLALLELADEFEAETFLGLAQQRAPSLGDEVFTVGCPLVGLLGDDPKYTDGTISALSGPGGDASFLQISVPVQPGNSGGPLVNEQGEVVGVVIATASAPVFFQVSGTIPQNINWAVRGLYAAALFEPPAEAPAMAETRGGMIERVQAATCLVLTEQ